MLFIIFLVIFSIIFILANIYIYKRLLMKIPFLFQHKRYAKIFIIILSLMQTSFLIFRADDEFNNTIYTIFAHSFAITYALFFTTIFADILGFCIKFYIKKTSKMPLRGEKRRRVKVFFNLALLLFGFCFVLKGWSNATSIPDVKELELTLPTLQKDLKMVMISDTHFGKNLNESFLKGIVEKINSLNPDFVVIVGDFVDTKPEDLGYISGINEIRADIYYALGNHEYYRGIDGILELLRQKTKLKILINDSFETEFLNIAAMADLAGLGRGNASLEPDINKTKAKLNLSKPSILLSHQPKSVLRYDVSNFDLVLSGHTHAGQVFPFGFLVKQNQGFLHGLYDLSEKTKLYVSSGAGFWGLSMRYLAKSEIVLFNLKAM
ncbi:metallophosphatase [Campylobacter avium LMG 24591]|uniref:Metallophosphatase n=1 Tax=Campylobacter avium LMG 24591 TaxID=522484 RepID=A0A222MW33_9BACT|nr:metallophosphoesterase [Campylobacter avium]ASQ30163.1 metallophosphatase [Campylobacter avium LMG 24591]OYD79261.1 metallophosphatase [Campylobacter avium]